MVRYILLTTALLTTLATASPEPARTTVVTPLGPVTAVSISSSYLIHTGATGLLSSSTTVTGSASSSSGSSETTTGGGPASATPKSTQTSSPANSNSGSKEKIGAGKAVVALVGALAGAMMFGL